MRLGPDELAAYRSKAWRPLRLFGDCVVEVDPLDLQSLTVKTPAIDK